MELSEENLDREDGFPIISDEVRMDKFRRSRVTIFTGAFGSGKTELSANFAAKLSDEYERVSLLDVDIVKPLFRSRELKSSMGKRNVKVVSTIPKLEMSDLPALSPEIFSSLEGDSCQVVMDVGGDDDGARVLGMFRDKINRAGYDMLYVINTRRPFTSSVEEVMFMLEGVKQACRIDVHGIVANTNLGAESTLDMALEGLEVIREVSKLSGIPVRFICINRPAIKDMDEIRSLSVSERLPVFIMDRFMLPPWEKEE